MLYPQLRKELESRLLQEAQEATIERIAADMRKQIDQPPFKPPPAMLSVLDGRSSRGGDAMSSIDVEDSDWFVKDNRFLILGIAYDE